MCVKDFSELSDMNLEYENIHSHSYYSNIMTHDSVISRNDIAKRAKELGHQTLSCLEHGYCGNLFEAYDVAQEHGLNLIFGTEFYYVKDRFEKDRTNSHVLVVAKTEVGREAITGLISEANTTGFYGRPRIDESLLFSLPPNDVIVTTACIASPVNLYDEEYAHHFVKRGKEYFGDNFFLEVQPHTNKKQQDFHEKLISFQKEYDIKMILGVDTHYIYEKDAPLRDIYLRSRDIIYPEEEGFIMDYPSVDTLIDRFSNQEVLNPSHVIEAMNSTLIVRDFEHVHLDTDIKMPSLYPDLNHEEKVKKLKGIINKAWVEDRKHIPKDRWAEYIEAIQFETKIIEDTKMEDYFLLNERVIDKAVNEYGGVLTRTGRGSAPSFYVNKLLGFTEVDRLEAPVTLFATRFMSVARILKSRSLPDVDFNTSDQMPFLKATKELMGEDNVYQMIAYGTMQEKDAFKTYCRGLEIPKSEYWDIADDLEKWSKTEKWGRIIEESKAFVNVVTSMSPHPCAVLLLSEPISKKVGVIRGKHDVMVTLIDSGMSDKYKYLKNDYLTVTVWDIISKVYDEIGMPIDDVRSLTSKIENDEKVWDLYKNGNVSTLNQAGTDSGKPQVMQYSPQSVRELSMWVSAIRPAFSSLKSTFLTRKDFSYGIKEFDKLLDTSDNFILFQESIMNVLMYVGFEESETYDLLKAIAKKKEGIIEPIHDRFIEGFVDKTGSMEDALEVWKIIENSVGYGFNSSHAYSVALDSLYGAYLKANYPLEYYTVVLNIYKNNKDKQAELIHELNNFGIRLSGLEFGKSQSEYSFDKESNTIYKGISTVAYLNSQVADNLYKLGSENNYKDDEFVKLALDIVDNNLVDNRQMNILIKLGYFSRFGEDSILLEVFNTMTGYQKKKPNPVILDGTNLAIKYARNHTEKTKQTRIPNIHKYYELVLKNKDLLPTTTLYQRLQNEVEYMGYATTIDMNSPENHYVVMDVNTKYTPVYKLYNVFDGHEATYKIDKKKAYKKDGNSKVNTKLVLNIGDVFEIVESSQRPKMQLVEGKWVKNEDVLQDYIENINFVNINVDKE